MKHNKYLTFVFLEDNDSIRAKSAAQILYLNLVWTFLLLNFLIPVLCNYSASSSVTLTPDPAFLSKNFRPYLTMIFDIHHIYNFYNRFHNILRLFDVLSHFSFATSETICDYYL